MCRMWGRNLTYKWIGTALELTESAETLTHTPTEKNVLIESDLPAFQSAPDPLPSLLGKIGPRKGTIGVIQAVRELLKRIAEKSDLTGVSSASDAREEVNLIGALFGS